MKTKILIVEDDPSILLGLQTILEGEGFEAAVCNRGDKVLETVIKRQPSLIVLDVMLPGANGFEICKQIRAKKFSIPILMLTAKGQELDKVIGLDSGADDYVTKPFGVRELVARIHALLRRSNGGGGAGKHSAENNGAFRIGSNEIDPRTLMLKRGKTHEELTARELKILQLMHGHPGEVFSRDRLLNEVWGYNYFGTTRTLDQCVVQIRKKLGDSGDNPKHLLTVHGVGYKLML
jgi:DNA-binding response OmpR family regulator